MAVQTLKIGRRQFVLVPKRDFDRLAQKARLEAREEEYWSQAALAAEAEAQAKGEKPIPFEQVERELNELAARRRAKGHARRGRRYR